MMKHFLEISQLSQQDMENLLERAFYFKNGGKYPGFTPHTVANMFYENSTRTRISFEIAAKRLGMTVINMDAHNSSEKKGEVMEDTIKTLEAMGIELFVIRHSQEKMPQKLAEKVQNNCHIINAGDGKHAHPSQAMLDLMTIIENKPNLNQIKIALVGNLLHSRVANSLQCLCKTFKIGDLALIAPKIWQPQEIFYGQVTDSLEAGLKEADVIICLRIQKERMTEHEHLDLAEYCRDFTINAETVKFAKSNAIVMHPGPINRGIEITSEVADGPQSVILDQVTNGVFMRMAILEALAIY